MSDDLYRSLEDEPIDRLAAVLRGSAGLIPIAGPLLSELINSFIPNQRVERISQYLSRLDELLRDFQRERLMNPFNIELIEDGGFQAIRAVSDHRINLLAQSVSEGIRADDHDKLDEKRILFIISQLDEGDVLLLDALDKRFSSPAHMNLRPDHPTIGSSTEIHNKNYLYEASKHKLERLGILNFSVKMNRELKMPNFDQFSGKPEGHYSVNSLGRRILFRAKLRPSEEP